MAGPGGPRPHEMGGPGQLRTATGFDSFAREIFAIAEAERLQEDAQPGGIEEKTQVGRGFFPGLAAYYYFVKY
jgi:hypothetical protein